MDKDVMFSTGKDDWETPEDFFRPLDREFGFTLDACANPQNAKCKRYYTEDDDGLKQDWAGETVWCNPPYSKGKQDLWVKKCWEEGQKPNTTVVMLIPARTDTDRFQRYVLGKAEVRCVKGRIKFVGAKHGAPFPSAVVIFKKRKGV